MDSLLSSGCCLGVLWLSTQRTAGELVDADRLARGKERQVKAEFVAVWRVMQHTYADLPLLERILAERRSHLLSDLPWQGLINALYVEYRRILLGLFEQG